MSEVEERVPRTEKRQREGKETKVRNIARSVTISIELKRTVRTMIKRTMDTSAFGDKTTTRTTLTGIMRIERNKRNTVEETQAMEKSVEIVIGPTVQTATEVLSAGKTGKVEFAKTFFKSFEVL